MADPAPGLPKLSTRVLQLIDEHHSVWDAFVTALDEHLVALAQAIRHEVIIDIGKIEQ